MPTKQPNPITPTNPKGRPKGSKNKRTLAREALQRIFPDGEAGFWCAIATQASQGDLQAAAIIADRLYPKLKPTSEPVVLSEPLDGTPAEVARSIMRMTGNGELTADTARELLASLADVCKIVELTELEQRIEKLEAMRDQET